MQINITITESFTDLAAFARFAAACEMLKGETNDRRIDGSRSRAHGKVSAPGADGSRAEAATVSRSELEGSATPESPVAASAKVESAADDFLNETGCTDEPVSVSAGEDLPAASADDAAPAEKPRRKRRTKAEMEAARAAEAALKAEAEGKSEAPKASASAADDWLGAPAQKPAAAPSAPEAKPEPKPAPAAAPAGDVDWSDRSKAEAAVRMAIMAALDPKKENGEAKMAAVYKNFGITGLRDASDEMLPQLHAQLLAI